MASLSITPHQRSTLLHIDHGRYVFHVPLRLGAVRGGQPADLGARFGPGSQSLLGPWVAAYRTHRGEIIRCRSDWAFPTPPPGTERRECRICGIPKIESPNGHLSIPSPLAERPRFAGWGQSFAPDRCERVSYDTLFRWRGPFCT